MPNKFDNPDAFNTPTEHTKPSNWLPNDVWMDSLAKQISSGAVICCVDDKVLVVKATYKDYWTFPGGVVDADETPIQAASREVAEELDLVIPVEKLRFSHVLVADKHQLKAYHFGFETDITQADVDQIKLQAEELESYQLLTKQQILSGEYGLMAYTITLWAQGKTGYHEFLGVDK